MQTITVLDDGRKFHDVEFQSSPCEGCGVCCRHFRVSFYQGECDSQHSSNEWSVPNEMVSVITPFLVAMKGTEQGKGKCIAFQNNGRCGIYEQRPSPCREFPLFMDDGSLNPECIRLRSMYGIAQWKKAA